MHVLHVLILLVIILIPATCQYLQPQIDVKPVLSGLDKPSSLFIQQEKLYVLSTNQQVLLKTDFLSSPNIILGVNNTFGYNGDGKLANDTTLSNPDGLFLNGSFIYVADKWNQRLRIVNQDTNIVQTIAGNGICGFTGDGQKVGANTQLCNPQGVFVEINVIYIADSFNNRIRMIDSNNVITTIAGSSSVGGFSGDGSLATNAKLFRPESVFVYQNQGQQEILIADTYNNRIRLVKNGAISTIAGGNSQGYNGDGIPAKDALLCHPSSVIATKVGEILIADYCNSKIRRIFTNGTISSLPINVRYPKSISLNPINNHLYISQFIDGNVQQVTFSCGENFRLNDNLVCEPVCQQDCIKKGKCLAPDVCECQDLFFGDFCEDFTCFGVEKDHQMVCSGHGKCTSPDNCECDINYNRNCSETTCFGTNSTNPEVCNSHGKCSLFNTCQCETNRYGGDECEIPLCNGRNESDSSVCSGNGICNTILSPASCICTRDMSGAYVGSDCQFPTCISIPSYESSVCSGHGRCYGFNRCECQDGYEGLFCESSSTKCGTGCVIGLMIGTGLVLGIFLAICFVILIKVRNNKRKEKMNKEMEYMTPYQNFIYLDKKYSLISWLGKGTFGSVYRYKEISNGETRLVAVKVIEMVLEKERSATTEVYNMQTLYHENIVQIQGHTIVGNGKFQCIIMPLYTGDLARWKEEIDVSIDLIIEIVRQIAKALQFIHENGMVHNDLKPQNIFIKQVNTSTKGVVDVSSFQLCVGDLGSAKPQERCCLTSVHYSDFYRSPEGTFSKKSDIWSLGCILYELLSSDRSKAIYQMKNEEDERNELLIANLKFRNSDKGERLKDLMLNMLKLNPEERISAAEILIDINQTDVAQNDIEPQGDINERYFLLH